MIDITVKGYRLKSSKGGTAVNNIRKVANIFRKLTVNHIRKRAKTVNRNQEKTVIIVKVVKVKVVKLNSEQGVELTIKYNF